MPPDTHQALPTCQAARWATHRLVQMGAGRCPLLRWVVCGEAMTRGEVDGVGVESPQMEIDLQQ